MNGKFSDIRAILSTSHTMDRQCLMDLAKFMHDVSLFGTVAAHRHIQGSRRAIMKQTCRNRITTWCLMGLLVVGLNVWFALPARAVPIDYTLAGGTAVGGFTLDDSLVNPYTTWHIRTTEGFLFSSLFDTAITNDSPAPGTFDLVTLNGSTPAFFELKVQLPNSYSIILLESGFLACGHPLLHVCDTGTLISSNSVPEASPGVLFLISLLVLAGARWWTHRQERLQLG